jgi:sucrose-6-phosphate hydrolase SacC (GH32 family)
MTLPRDLTLETRGQGVSLIQRPVPELDQYEVQRHVLDLDISETRTAEVEVPGTGAEALRLRYDRDTGLLSLDRRGAGPAAYNPAFAQVVAAPVEAVGDVVRVDVVVDRCSVEVFAGNGEVVLTALDFRSET